MCLKSKFILIVIRLKHHRDSQTNNLIISIVINNLNLK